MKKSMTGLWAAILVCGAVAGASAGDSANNVTPDTIAYWPFDTGAELADAAGNGHALANTGAAFSAGAAVFNAANSSKLVTLSALPFSTYSNLTIECFVKMDINLSVVQPEFGFVYSTGATYAAPGSINFYQTYGTSLIGDFYNTSGGFDQENNQDGHYSVGISSWHHAAVVIDSSKSGTDPDRLQLYVDKIRMKKSILTSTHADLSDALFYIGTLGTQTGYHFTGQIDDIRITATALSPGEFLQTRTISSIAYWPFNPSEELVDATGNGHTLTNIGVQFSAEAAVFNAANSSKLVTLSTLPFSTYSDLTIECFFKMDINLSIDYPEFGFLYSTGATYAAPGSIYFYQTYGTSLIGDFYNTSGGFDQENNQGGHYALGIGSWHHAAVVIDSSKSGTDPDRLQLYVDKIRMKKSILTSTHADLSDALFYIGTLGTQTGYHFTGQIDDIRITATALSPGEFLQKRTRTVNTVAYWPFNPGEELVDASGNGHTLSNNSVTFTKGAASFSSALASGLSTDSAIPFADSVDQTLEFFFCTTSQTATHRMLLMTGGTYGLPGTLSCYGDPGLDNLAYDIYDSAGLYHKRMAPAGINDGQWHHVALLVDSSKTGSERLKMYVDRVEQPVITAQSSNAILSNNKLYLGTAGTQGNLFFDGQMDDVRITAAALSPDEFLSIRTRAANTNCIAYWPFNPDDELADASGNGHTLSNNQVSFANGAACFSSALSSRLATLVALPFEDLDDVTVEFFFSTTNQTPTYRTLLITGVTYGMPGSLICYGQPDFDDLITDLHDSGTRLAKRAASGNINDGKWHHVAIQIDSSKSGADPERLKMYIDRIEQRAAATYSLDPVLRNNILCLGGQSLNNTAFFDGRMDDVRITGRLLSTSEFMSDKQRTVDYDCIAYWPFKAGRELEDASGNGHTLVNSHVTFQAGYALFDKELSAHLITAAKLPFNDPIDLTLEYFVRTSYVPQNLSYAGITHAGPVYGEPGTFATYINSDNRMECDISQISRAAYNQERSRAGLLTDGEWHHVALVIERSTFRANPENWFRLYIDGQRETAIDRTLSSTNPFLINNKFYLGSIGEQTTSFFEGILDDVRITGKALDPSEFMSQRSKSEGTLLLLR